jgi:hypothetical protein
MKINPVKMSTAPNSVEKNDFEPASLELMNKVGDFVKRNASPRCGHNTSTLPGQEKYKYTLFAPAVEVRGERHDYKVSLEVEKSETGDEKTYIKIGTSGGVYGRELTYNLDTGKSSWNAEEDGLDAEFVQAVLTALKEDMESVKEASDSSIDTAGTKEEIDQVLG